MFQRSKNMKIQGRSPSVDQISNPKVQFEITPKIHKKWTPGGGGVEILFGLKTLPVILESTMYITK